MLHRHNEKSVCPSVLSETLPVCAIKVLDTWLKGHQHLAVVYVQHVFPANVTGMPSMTQEEMLAATLAGSGPKKVSKGKIRRKKGQTRGLAELAGLR